MRRSGLARRPLSEVVARERTFVNGRHWGRQARTLVNGRSWGRHAVREGALLRRARAFVNGRSCAGQTPSFGDSGAKIAAVFPARACGLTNEAQACYAPGP